MHSNEGDGQEAIGHTLYQMQQCYRENIVTGDGYMGEVVRAAVLHCWSEKVLGRRESLGKELRRKRGEPSPHPGKEHSKL